MTFNNLAPLGVKQVITSERLNQMLENIELFRTPPRHFYEKTSGNYSTSSTSLADIDATNVNASLTTTGNPVRVNFRGGRSTMTATTAEISILVDGVDPYGSGIWRVGSTEIPVNLGITIDGLAAGVHTFKLQFKINGAGTFTIQGANIIQFEVYEL
jgi:hypothetical protein